jgi:hypothetical protein
MRTMTATWFISLFIIIGFSFGGCDKCNDDCDDDCVQADDAGADDSTADDDSVDDDAFVDPQIELTEPIPLLNTDGTLRARGWARTPLIEYNPEYIPRNFNLRVKVWDHYTIVTPEFGFTVTISDISIATFASYELVNFADKKVTSGTNLMLGSHGGLPASPLESTYYQNGDSYMNILYDNGTRTIEADIKESLFGCAFSGTVVMEQRPGDENPAAAEPFYDPRFYFYENKIFGMPTSGTVTFDGRTYTLDPADSFAVLDWGRGVWPHATQWHWGFAAGYHNGKIIGFNIGDGCSDDSLGTSNAQKFDGVVHKLYHVYFDYDLPNLMAPWEITSDADKLRATLTPIYHQKTGLVILDIGMLVDKMYGTFDGRITLDDGSQIEFTDMYGFIERSNQRW